MLRNVTTNIFKQCRTNYIQRFINTVEEKQLNTLQPQIETVEIIPVTPEENKSVLEKCDEDISHVAPYLKPSFNFAAYVNQSETLQEFVKLGVNLYKLEKNAKVPPLLLKLDFEKDVKKYIMFLDDIKVENIGDVITKNPFIFQEDINNLYIRINYLKSKKFDDHMVTRIVQKNPLILSFSTQDIDKRLGFFQSTYELSGNEVRLLATKAPKLITYSPQRLKLNTFALKEEMGFSNLELKEAILECPSLLIKDQKSVLKTFEYLHKSMQIPIEQILKSPQVLTCRVFRIKQRHEFLKLLGKVQYNPREPNFISLNRLTSGTDSHFATEVVGSSIQAFNTYLKSL